jgi:ABC-2 type transport system ATP-binding protein
LERVCDQLGIADCLHDRAGELPIGWRQRLALAIAIVHQPPLLFLDEPTSGVDPQARRAFWDVIYTLVDEGVTALVTTHYLDEAEYCTRVGIMRRGKLLAVDSPSGLKRNALHGEAWSVRAEPVLRALQVTGGVPGIMRVGLAGDHLRAITAGRIQPRELHRILKRSGLHAVRVTRVEPTLEDIFLALAEA